MKEQQRVIESKMRGMNIMDQNRAREQEKESLRRKRANAEKDHFNKQMNEINFHAQQREEK